MKNKSFKSNEFNIHYKIFSNFRQNIQNCRSLEELIDISLKKIHENLSVQVASIFLVDKEGFVSRKGIFGTDSNGDLINQDWFKEESYSPGESFSALAVPKNEGPEKDNYYGSIQWARDFNSIKLNPRSKRKYIETLGKLVSAVSVPLNDTNQTFGTLELINKIDSQNNRTDFSLEDINWITSISNIVSTEITLLRQANELEIFKDLSQKLINRSILDISDTKEIYKLITESLTTEFLPYKCCILRIYNNGFLEVADISAPNVSIESRNNSKISINENSITGTVFVSKEPKFYTDINESSDKHSLNRKWAKEHFKSHACYPLIVKNECVGTLSVFTANKCYFFHNEKIFINALTSLAASYIDRVSLELDLMRAEEEIHQERDMIVRAAHSIGTNSFIQEMSHRYKSELVSLEEKLLEIYDHPPSQREEYINQQIQEIRKRIDEVGKAFYTPESIENININNISKKIVRLVKNRAKSIDARIKIIEEYDIYIETITANPIKIESVLYNILINSLNAIKDSKTVKGLIEVSTGLIQSKSRLEANIIQVIIRDNGVGMEKEIFEKIFEKGFSTNENRGGTGIGLYVCKEIITSYSGQIDVWSEKGKGTMFTIQIPAQLQNYSRK